jgi:hypothetical protein
MENIMLRGTDRQGIFLGIQRTMLYVFSSAAGKGVSMRQLSRLTGMPRGHADSANRRENGKKHRQSVVKNRPLTAALSLDSARLNRYIDFTARENEQ